MLLSTGNIGSARTGFLAADKSTENACSTAASAAIRFMSCKVVSRLPVGVWCKGFKIRVRSVEIDKGSKEILLNTHQYTPYKMFFVESLPTTFWENMRR